MIEDFTYYTPTKVVFGRGAENKTGELVAGLGCKKTLLHYGGGSAERTGLLGRIRESLREAGVSFVELGGVVPNPRLSLVNEGIELCRREGVDFILAVGGGSVIDSAKAIAYGVADEERGDVWDFYARIRVPRACLPVGSVLTIAAAGSEMSCSSVITDEATETKRGYGNDLCRPKFAVMNPELTMTLPAYQTACGCVDILMHTMERWFGGGGRMELTDGIAAALMRTVIRNAKILVAEPENYDARAEVMWAGSLSHNGLTGCGTDGGDWATHQLEHEIGAIFDVAHGAGLAAVWGSWARYVYKENPARFAQFAAEVMGVQPAATDEETALAGIAAMEDFYRELKMPVTIRGLGIEPTEAQLKEMAEKCAAKFEGGVGTMKKLSAEDMEKIFRAAM
ncbi:iron-containing alcohol dehydrogenase [uncultured Cloacibacillus sp.]|uniref:iron-containing alcohol dehydrogenase n=1 Tax=uncultured Cloacibacillus sp. TaxID=889794 RepID=UPI0025D67105|nr:iron-containing alcohol dehydrogenase [uncultured Cloacibacillus sp.]